MNKVAAKVAKGLIKSSSDYVYKCSDSNLRERWCVINNGLFYRVEGNTNGFYVSNGEEGFSLSVHWVLSC